jgi:hypothetical protein
MKKISYLSGLFITLIVTSCADNKSDDPSSPEPTSDARDKFVAYWNVNETSALTGPNSNTVNIVKSTTNSSEVLLNNFSGLSLSARASINNNILTIPYQSIGSPNSIGFTQGSGTLTSATSISFNYTTTIGNSRDSSTAVYTKQ